MQVSEVKEFCANLPEVLATFGGGCSNILVYKIGGKKFAYFKTSDPEKWRFSVRVSPDRFLELTDQPGVKPARYMYRFHWVTVVDVSAFDTEYLRELIHCSYKKAFSSLSKKLQHGLNAELVALG